MNYLKFFISFLSICYTDCFLKIIHRLATGSCNRNIHLWQLRDNTTWHVDQRPLNAHTDSVEDLQWSPNEENVSHSFFVLLMYVR